ncbi:SRPBCC domain-containing protein [Phenylobacterium deserti]|uniref:SRPBCC domain-containing protein n=1 Tax=Phenylobacterium deserti TaxID=1914756 RepID=A0A328AT56_9CAUL|nr:SRPBCC domain-containing protein [Phenylobacterium deserti]
MEHRVGIQAPAEVIWDVIYDLESWDQWNPLYTKASGDIRIGGKLDLTMVLPGQAPRQIQPTVLEWVPHEQLHWRLTMLSGFIVMTRYIEIEALAEESCIVSNGEIIGGMMGGSLAKRTGGALNRSFRDMGEALKARSEEIWRARKG